MTASVVEEQRARRAFGQLQREKAAWRLGYADALLGHEPAIDVWPGVEPEYRAAYLEGRAAAVDAGRFGTASAHRPSLALRAAILREEVSTG
jgi:hypothetical protein